MYQKFFRLQQRPFSATPDPNVLYNAPSVRHCLTELEQALRLGEGIGLMTAEAGTGKTLVCKVLTERLANDPIPVLLLNSTYSTRSSLLQAVLFELGRPYARMSEQELRLELVASGRRIAESQTGIALIVDEAHLLGEHILEELRALTNFVYQARPIFRVVLSGQMAVEDILARRSMEAVNQRLRCHVALERLSQQESLEYIITRVSHAGGQLLEVFNERALELIVHAADGLPRCLNQLCDHACLLASVAGERPVQPQHVREALHDLQKLPLHWNTPLPAGDPISMLQPEKKSRVEKPSATNSFEPTTAQATVIEWGTESVPQNPGKSPDAQPLSQDSAQKDQAHAGVYETGGDLSADTTVTVEESESPTAVSPIPAPAVSQSVLSPGEAAELVTPVDISVDSDDELEELEAELAAELELTQQKSTPQISTATESAAELEVEVSEQSAVSETEISSIETTETVQDIVAEEKPLEPAPPVISATDTDFEEELLEAELLEEIQEIRKTLPHSQQHSAPDATAASNQTAEMSFPCREEVTAEREQVNDHYARLDALRIGQLSQSPAATSAQTATSSAHTFSGVETPEEVIGQAVLEMCDHVSAGLAPDDEDAFPSPEQLLLRGIESQQARYDVVDPEPEPSPYDRLYSELRRRKA